LNSRGTFASLCKSKGLALPEERMIDAPSSVTVAVPVTVIHSLVVALITDTTALSLTV